MENNEKVVVNGIVKFENFLKGLGIFVLTFLGFVFVPFIIGSVVYSFGLSESVSTLIGNVSFLVLLFVIYRKMLIGKIKDYFRHFSRYFGDGLKYWAFGFLVMAVSNLILSYVIGDIAANEEANREFINGNLLVGFCSVVLVAPFVEEMMFRFTAKKMVSNDKWFPLVSAVLFGLAHIVFANNSSLLEYLYVIPYGALGYSFGYAYVKTDNIYTSMFLHAMHNFISFMAVAFMA